MKNPLQYAIIGKLKADLKDSNESIEAKHKLIVKLIKENRNLKEKLKSYELPKITS